MKKLLLILLITNSLFAQEKTTSAFLYWTPLAVWGDETWAFGNKVGLGIERKLSKKFDLRFNINNGNYTRSAGNVVSNYSKSSIVNVDLDSRFMFSRNRRINVFVETGVNYSRFHTYEIEIVFEHEIYKTYDIYRENFIDSHLL